jgi:hypothetical protein
VNSVGDGFSFPFRDPGWVGKILVQGLILIIPIVGAIALVGWVMITWDNIRAGRQELAPAGFHLSRGIGLFGVLIIYYIAAEIPAIILSIVGGIMNRGNSFAGSPVLALGDLLSFAASLLIAFLLPAIYVMTYHHGFSGGLNVEGVWRLVNVNLSNTLIAALVMYVAGIIAAVGLLACCVGVFFTATYAAAVVVGTAAWYERVQAAPPGPAAA